MGRISKMISFTSDAVKIMEGLPRGESSRICNEAIMSIEPENMTIEEVRREISFIKEDQKKSKKKLKYLQTRQKIIEETVKKEQIVYTKQKTKEDKEKEISLKVKTEKSLALHKSKALELFDISEQDAEKFSKKYLTEKNRGSFLMYFEKLNFKKRIKK